MRATKQSLWLASSHSSAAAPLVSGIVALILTVNPRLTAAEVEKILHETSDKIDAGNAAYNDEGFSSTYGYGRINALSAVKRAAQDL